MNLALLPFPNENVIVLHISHKKSPARKLQWHKIFQKLVLFSIKLT